MADDDARGRDNVDHPISNELLKLFLDFLCSFLTLDFRNEDGIVQIDVAALEALPEILRQFFDGVCDISSPDEAFDFHMPLPMGDDGMDMEFIADKIG